MKNNYLWPVLILGFLSCSPTTQKLKSKKGGNCYAKAIFPTSYLTQVDTFYQYIGNDFDQEGINFIKIETKPAGKVWEKKKSTTPCHSTNPDDCLVWCLVDIPAEVDSFYIIEDLSQTNEYEMVIKERKIISTKSYTDWTEVICEKQITNDLIEELSRMLVAKQYLVKSESKINKTFQQAIQNYQKENGLAYGPLTKEVVDHLRMTQRMN